MTIELAWKALKLVLVLIGTFLFIRDVVPHLSRLEPRVPPTKCRNEKPHLSHEMWSTDGEANLCPGIPDLPMARTRRRR